MSDRVILAVKFTPAAPPGQLRKAVGGFLRYVQYRDKHKDSATDLQADPKVSGMLKYVAHRDGATRQGRLFGPAGPASDQERRELASFVARSIAATRPQVSMRGGEPIDRRRAVYRFVLSPEHAAGLDLRRLTTAAIERLEREAGGGELRWIAAEHTNTAHPHVHIVLAGMREPSPGRYRGLVITPRRLAAMKEELALEISRQREASPRSWVPSAPAARPVARPAVTTGPAQASRRLTGEKPHPLRLGSVTLPRVVLHSSTFMRLQAAAMRYRRMVEREAEEESLRRRREVERW